MKSKKNLTRREFLTLAGTAAAASAVAACAPAGTTLPTSAPAPTSAAAAPTAAATQAVAAPTVLKPRTVRIAVGGWAEQNMKDLLAKTDFAKQTGITPEIVLRTDTKETELTRLASAVQAGTSPYDVIDFEDELTTTFSRAGYVIGLDDLLPSGFWDDFSKAMVDYSKTWSTYNGETFRIIHNWEMPYWWYRKDWFDQKGVQVPTTWDEVKAMGKVFTDESKGVWASIDGLIKGAFLNVYLAWITLQAGGNPFDVGPEYKTALEYIHDLMYTSKVLNPASLQTDYNQQNAAYIADKVAFMRQWPFFGDVARSKDNEAWFKEDKVVVALPPVGPGGKGGSTYAAAWGWGIVKTSPNLDAAKDTIKFLTDKNWGVSAMQLPTPAFWFLSARKSTLDAAPQDNWLVKQLKMYTDAGVIGVRPFHPKFVEALTVLEDTASAYLTNQISLDDSLKQAKDGLAKLG
ncbi:MAG TPA: extracellular solute-binding protein [Anaerolineae bacterium]|nr:extracellular solute-binding protein [Anaerolineae bacterium]